MSERNQNEEELDRIVTMSNNNTANSTDIEERLEVLFRQESSFYLTTDYLSTLIQQRADGGDDDTSASSGGSKMLNQHWREVMCEWAYHGK